MITKTKRRNIFVHCLLTNKSTLTLIHNYSGKKYHFLIEYIIIWDYRIRAKALNNDIIMYDLSIHFNSITKVKSGN